MTTIDALKQLQKRKYCVRENKGCGDEHCSGSGNGCPFEYHEGVGNPEHNYKGHNWPPPRRWIALDGTHVYRTYSDYIDD